MIKVCITLFVFLVLLFRSSEVQSQIDTSGADTPEEIILKFTYERVLESVIFSYYYKNQVYVPVETILKILQVNIIFDEQTKKYTGFYINPEDEFSIDFKNFNAVFKEKKITFTKNEILPGDKTGFALPSVFEKLFGLEFKVNLNNLTLTLATLEKLPILLKIERENKRELNNSNKSQDGPLIFKRKRRIINAGFFDYSLSGSYTQGTNPIYNYDFSLGTEIIGGELSAFARGTYPNLGSAENNLNTNLQWKYTFNKNNYITTFNAGSLSSNGLNSINFNGVSLTNTPTAPRISYSSYTVFEKTIPNSEVEIYINNILYDYKKSDEAGNVTFQIPLNYGSSVVNLKIYGPNGELLEHDKRIQVPVNFLPQGEINYNLSVGKRATSGEFITSANVYGGITDWITNNIGVDYINQQIFNKPLFYNSVYSRIFTDYLFSYTFAPELYHSFSFFANYYSLLAYGITYYKYKENPYYNSQNQLENLQLNAMIPLSIGDFRISSQVSGTYSKYADEKVYLLDVLESFDIAGFHPFIDYRVNKYEDFTGGSNKTEMLSAGFLTGIPYFYQLSNIFSGTLLNTKLDFDVSQKKFSDIGLSLATNVTQAVRVQFNFNRNFLINSTDFNVQLSYELSHTKVYNTISDKSYTSIMQGSIGLDATRKGKVLFYNKQKTGTGGATFRLFIDNNGNGKYDEGEELVKGVELYMRQVILVEKDKDEIIRVSDLIPYMEYSVELKDEKQPIPMLVPLYKKFTFTADPNGFKKIDIPFYYSAEVSGKVTTISNNKVLEIPGLRVVIANLETGDTITAMTYADGSFYCTGLLSGKYRASLSREDLKMYHAEPNSESHDFEIKPGSRGEGIEELNFTVLFRK